MNTEYTDTTVTTINKGSAGRRRATVARVDWLPLLVLPVLAVAFRNLFADWLFMWLLAVAIWAGCKWLTWRAGAPGTSRSRSFFYLFGWPGLDARNFLTGTTHNRATGSEWVGALTRIAAGAVLVALASRSSLDRSSLAVAWAGMTGVVLFLHFGLFDLLALTYRRGGIDATPLMRRPTHSTSLSDFWGSRWNTSFSRLAHDLVFRPLVRPLGTAWAALAVFLVSGVIHDMVISLPARSGYGLPTLYFALQGVAVLFERSRTGRRLGVGRSWQGRVFALSLTVLPMPLLFHAGFSRNVMLPMLQAIGGLGRTP